MNEDRWRRIEELYHAARLLNDSARGPFLAAATEGDEALRHEVESLLASGASSPGFLDEPLHMNGAGPRGSDAASLSGRRIGTYSVHERIGAGGMGEVYRAHDSKLRRDVALKVLAADLIGHNDQQRQDHLRQPSVRLASSLSTSWPECPITPPLHERARAGGCPCRGAGQRCCVLPSRRSRP
jgi:hypothetical protein